MAVRLTTAQPKREEITYEEYLRMPETMQRYEIIDGEMYMPPAPTEDHQWTLSDLNDHLKAFVREHQLGVVLFAPFDLIIRKTPKLTTRQPDLLFFSAARIGGTSRADLKRALQAGIGPDLVVEILSPEERQRRLSGKLADYAGIDVTEVWVICPEAQTIEVLRLKQGQYERAGLYARGERVTSALLPGFSLPVEAIFD